MRRRTIVVATVPIGMGVDGTAFDPAWGDVFVASADGTLDVVHQDAPDRYRKLTTLATPIGSRNLGLDPTTHRVFVAAAKFGPVPAGGRRGPVLSNSFSLLVIER